LNHNYLLGILIITGFQDGRSIQSVELFPGGSAAKELVKLDTATSGHITSLAYDKHTGALYYVLNLEHRVSEIWLM